MTTRRRIMAALTFGTLVLAACGGASGTDTASGDTPLNPTATTPAPSDDGDDQSVTTTQPSATNPARTDSGPDTSIDAAKESDGGARRIVVGNQLLLDPALALGLPVVGVAAPTDRDGVPPYLADLGSGVEVVAAAPDPNYEQLLGLAPDLIVVPEEAAETGVIDLLTDIAPTETTPANTATPWPDVLRELATLTGRTAQAETLIAEWELRVDEFRTASGGAADLEVSLVRCFRDSCRYLPGTTSFAGYVLDQLGVARPEIQQADPEGRPFVEIGLEQIDLLDGDVIVLFGSDADDSIAALEANPLWGQLRAVQDDRVYRADPFAWFQGNVIAAGVIADELQGWLTEP